MSRTIGVIADTHGLLRPAVLEAFAGVELILHAGDVGEAEILVQLRHVAPVRAVRGNTDGPGLGLPETDVVELGDVSLYLIHDLARLDLDPRAAGLAAVVHGHSHSPSSRREDGVLFFNPGSAGPRRHGLPLTVGRLFLDERGPRGEVIDLER